MKKLVWIIIAVVVIGFGYLVSRVDEKYVEVEEGGDMIITSDSLIVDEDDLDFTGNMGYQVVFHVNEDYEYSIACLPCIVYKANYDGDDGRWVKQADLKYLIGFRALVSTEGDIEYINHYELFRNNVWRIIRGRLYA